MSTWHFVKGHGTGNDFLILTSGPDPTPLQVAALCDRHTGLGADGILRAEVRDGGWFMDYRNADGSLAEMCGNGIRVFARWLVLEQLAPPGTWPVATRGGVRTVDADPVADIRVDMGPPRIGEPALVDGRPATAVDMGNPHLVVNLSEHDVRTADLTLPPPVEPPQEVNVELVARTGERELTMRVHERGVGETLSCGTGACAAAVAAAQWTGEGPDGEPWTVRVPGGALTVTWTPETVHLSGPAVLFADGEITL